MLQVLVQCLKEKAYEHEASSGIGDLLLCGKYLPIKENKKINNKRL
jgi:hypothetical protein